MVKVGDEPKTLEWEHAKDWMNIVTCHTEEYKHGTEIRKSLVCIFHDSDSPHAPECFRIEFQRPTGAIRIKPSQDFHPDINGIPTYKKKIKIDDIELDGIRNLKFGW